MADETMMDDGMDEMYPSDTEGTPSKETPESIDEEESEVAAKTALVPKKSLNCSCKVGDTVSMRVVADYGDEVELEPVSGSETESDETTEMSAEDEIEALDKE